MLLLIVSFSSAYVILNDFVKRGEETDVFVTCYGDNLMLITTQCGQTNELKIQRICHRLQSLHIISVQTWGHVQGQRKGWKRVRVHM